MCIVGVAAALVLGACGAGASDASAGGAATEAARSEAGLEAVPLSITSGGQTHRFRVEVARTDEQQRKGLMFRDRLAPDW